VAVVLFSAKMNKIINSHFYRQMANLILDMDGTLVQDVKTPDSIPRPRPHLQEFIRFAFAHFKHVSVWSAAGEEWVSSVLEQVVLPLTDGQNFHFVWTGKKVTRRHWSVMGGDYSVTATKKLIKVYKAFPDYTKHNTFILDDTPETYKHNYGNAISIPTWYGDPEDKALLTVMTNLEKWQKEYEEIGTVRRVNKFA